MLRQYSNIRGLIMGINNRFNKVHPLFFPLNPEFSPENKLINIFSDYFLFHSLNRKYKSNVKNYLCKLEDITLQSSFDSLTVVVVSDMSIKNHIASFIAHVHILDVPTIKIIYHVFKISSIEAELFAIRYGINQATYLPNIKRIMVIMNFLHTARKIFDSSIYSYQTQSTAISCKLREFFERNTDNSIEFWNFPSHCNWSPHSIINKETKSFNLILILLCKLSWDFSRKNECNNILNNWKIHFQASNDKGRNFLGLCDNNMQIISSLTYESSIWLKYFGYLNSLCVRTIRAIVNHAPIGEYQLRFFPKEKFECLCSSYLIKSRQYILHNCKKYNNYWNLRRNIIAHFTLFLKFNSGAFSFNNSTM